MGLCFILLKKSRGAIRNIGCVLNCPIEIFLITKSLVTVNQPVIYVKIIKSLYLCMSSEDVLIFNVDISTAFFKRFHRVINISSFNLVIKIIFS